MFFLRVLCIREYGVIKYGSLCIALVASGTEVLGSRLPEAGPPHVLIRTSRSTLLVPTILLLYCKYERGQALLSVLRRSLKTL